jgi:cytochrome P450 / NADPH-cytochrome P450 reductase
LASGGKINTSGPKCYKSKGDSVAVDISFSQTTSPYPSGSVPRLSSALEVSSDTNTINMASPTINSINNSNTMEECPVSHLKADGERQCSVAHSSASTSGTKPEEDHTLIPIPQPPTSWFRGNLPDIDPSFMISSVWKLADIWGPIFQLDFVARKMIVISNHEMIDEVCDDSRFQKFVSGNLEQTRALLGDGLFSAYSEEPNWHLAHRILMPSFGPLSIRKQFNQMQDIASQMIMKWDRLGPDNEIVCSDDFTRLAFDTIALCTFNYRFNSFYQNEPVAFARQLADVLIESGKRGTRLPIENYLRIWSAQQNQENVRQMRELADYLVAERKRNPKPEVNDLLNVMLQAKDPQTGEKLSDENIRYQMITFLGAGHETTSGTLSFLFYHLLKNPETLHKAQQEVDEVLGDSAFEEKHLNKLKYIEACIRETLRYQGPISLVVRHSKEDETVIGGKYKVERNQPILSNFRGLHRDPKVWGDDADLFRPERMLNGGFESLPRNAWKAFGTGARACIGQIFAEQEMIMNVAMILQRFNVEMADPSYNLSESTHRANMNDTDNVQH